jgi:TonB family protein
MFDMPFMRGWILVATLAQLGLPALALVIMIALRLRRRGGARFGAAPAVAALVLLPLPLAAAITCQALQGALGGLGPNGSVSIIAIITGLSVSMLALRIGFLSAAALAFPAIIAIAVGGSRVPSDWDEEEGGGAGPLAVLLLALFTAGLLAFSWMLLTRFSELNPAATAKPQLYAGVGAAALLIVLLFMVIAGALYASGGPTSIAPAALCGVLVAVAAGGSVGGLWMVHRRLACFEHAASAGTICDDLEYPPELKAGLSTLEPAEPTSPPPPTPPPTLASPDSAAPTPAPEAIRVGGAIREPRKIRDVSPVYPDLARRARVQGQVILECTISPEGNVTAVRVRQGPPLLEQAAVEAVRQWQYSPTLLNGVAVPVIMTVTITFRLSS